MPEPRHDAQTHVGEGRRPVHGTGESDRGFSFGAGREQCAGKIASCAGGESRVDETCGDAGVYRVLVDDVAGERAGGSANGGVAGMQGFAPGVGDGVIGKGKKAEDRN